MFRFKKIWRRGLIFFAALFLLVGVLMFPIFHEGRFVLNDEATRECENQYVNYQAGENLEEEDDVYETEAEIDIPTVLPENFSLDVHFLSQAPFSQWDVLHEEACEEASLVMVKKFLEGGKENISLPQGEREILKLVEFEKKNGYGVSVMVEDLGIIAKKFYGGLNYEIKDNLTIEEIKSELVRGNPIIVPAAGKVLNNPNFRNGGPNYHMLVVRGYDASGFITNDPGTRKGENFHYTFENFMNSVHDWNAENILKGEKRFLVLKLSQ